MILLGDLLQESDVNQLTTQTAGLNAPTDKPMAYCGSLFGFDLYTYLNSMASRRALNAE